MKCDFVPRPHSRISEVHIVTVVFFRCTYTTSKTAGGRHPRIYDRPISEYSANESTRILHARLDRIPLGIKEVMSRTQTLLTTICQDERHDTLSRIDGGRMRTYLVWQDEMGVAHPYMLSVQPQLSL